MFSKIIDCSGLVIAIVLFITSYPLVKGWIKMNGFWGFRFPAAFSSEENWYKINKYGGKLMLMSSGVFMLIGLMQYFKVITNNLNSSALLQIVYLVIVLVPAVLSYLYTKRI